MLSQTDKCKLITSEIEKDLRRWIVKEILPFIKLKNIIDEKVYEKIYQKYLYDQKLEGNLIDLSKEKIDDIDLINYTDLGESFNILRKNKKILKSQSQLVFKDLDKKLEFIIPRRNKIHQSFTQKHVFEVEVFVKHIEKYEDYFPNVFGVIKRLKDDSSDVFDEKLLLHDENTIENNLPIPIYKDTGFIERIDLNVKLDRYFKKNAATAIIGHAGSGKTALATKLSYDYVAELGMFDRIWWFTFKTQSFSKNEIINLENSLKSSLEFFSEFSSKIEGKNKPIDNIIEYLKKSKILLVLDNLETISHDQNIVDFLEKFQDADHKSKIIITSREPIEGATTIKVKNFLDSEAKSYFRSLVDLYDLELLKKINDSEVIKLTKKRENNPFGIKLSLKQVAQNWSVEKSFEPSKNFLDYCYKNLFSKLNANSKICLECFYYQQKEYTSTGICTLTEILPDEVELSIKELMDINFLNAHVVESGSTYFSIKHEIKLFIEKNKFFTDFIKKAEFGKKNKELITTIAKTTKINVGHFKNIPFDYDSFYPRKNSDLASWPELLKINNLSREIEKKKKQYFYEENLDTQKQISTQVFNQTKLVKDHLEFLKKKHPDYCEVFRVAGVFHASIGDIVEMKQNFEKAIHLEPSYQNIRVFYATRLRILDELQEAKEVAATATDLFPDFSEAKLELLRCKYYLSEFDDETKKLHSFFEDFVPKIKNFIFQKKVVKIIIDYYHRYSDFIIVQKKYKDYDKAFEAIKSLHKAFEKYEKLQMIDVMTTRSTIHKSFPQIIVLKKYYQGTEKWDVLKKIHKSFDDKVDKYLGGFHIKKNKKILKEGDNYEGIYEPYIVNPAWKKVVIPGGYISFVDALLKDVDNKLKKKIFINKNFGGLDFNIGDKVKFKVIKVKNNFTGKERLVASNAELIK